jgi:hypothetical protein
VGKGEKQRTSFFVHKLLNMAALRDGGVVFINYAYILFNYSAWKYPSGDLDLPTMFSFPCTSSSFVEDLGFLLYQDLCLIFAPP